MHVAPEINRKCFSCGKFVTINCQQSMVVDLTLFSCALQLFLLFCLLLKGLLMMTCSPKFLVRMQGLSLELGR